MSNEKKLTVEFMNPEKVKFSFNENGFLTVEAGEEYAGRVKLVKSYPYSFDDEYICVQNLEDKELGIIRDLKELDKGSYDSAVEELRRRYYCPKVSSVKSIKERMGHFYFETVIDGKDKHFTVRDLTRNMRFIENNTLLIFDVDGNRYIIPDYEKIETKSKRLLEPYLY